MIVGGIEPGATLAGESTMSVFNLLRRRGSAPFARERLQVLLSHERMARGQSDLIAILRDDILAAISKQVAVDFENIQVRMNRGATASRLEIEVEIPNLTRHSPRSDRSSVGSASSGFQIPPCDALTTLFRARGNPLDPRPTRPNASLAA
jgi:cell division topological specificity factor